MSVARIISLDRIMKQNGGQERGDSLSVRVDTGTLSIVRRKSLGFTQEMTHLKVIGKFTHFFQLHELRQALMGLNDGEKLLRHTTGPSSCQKTVYYKFNPVGSAEEATLLKALNSRNGKESFRVPIVVVADPVANHP